MLLQNRFLQWLSFFFVLFLQYLGLTSMSLQKSKHCAVQHREITTNGFVCTVLHFHLWFAESTNIISIQLRKEIAWITVISCVESRFFFFEKWPRQKRLFTEKVKTIHMFYFGRKVVSCTRPKLVLKISFDSLTLFLQLIIKVKISRTQNVGAQLHYVWQTKYNIN